MTLIDRLLARPMPSLCDVFLLHFPSSAAHLFTAAPSGCGSVPTTSSAFRIRVKRIAGCRFCRFQTGVSSASDERRRRPFADWYVTHSDDCAEVSILTASNCHAHTCPIVPSLLHRCAAAATCGCDVNDGQNPIFCAVSGWQFCVDFVMQSFIASTFDYQT